MIAGWPDKNYCTPAVIANLTSTGTPDGSEAAPLPARLAGIMERPERSTLLPREAAAVQRYIEARARALRAEA